MRKAQFLFFRRFLLVPAILSFRGEIKVHSPVHLLKNISYLVSRKCKNILKRSGPRTDVEGIG